MRKISADWIFPGNGSPVFRGVLVVAADGSILDLLDPEKVEVNNTDVEYYDGILCPGFVNTHCHLELSYLQGRIEQHTGLDAFIRCIEKNYKQDYPGAFPEQTFYLRSAEQQMREEGIIAVGDIVSYPPSSGHQEVKENSSLYFHSFAEVYGSNATQALIQYRAGVDTLAKIRSFSNNNTASLSPHATYSVSGDLFMLLRVHIDSEGLPSTIHHLENRDEINYLAEGTGSIPSRLDDWEILNTGEPLRGDRPLLALFGYLPHEARLLLVHNTFATNEDILIAGTTLPNAYWCLCPNANLFIEKMLPDISVFRDIHHRITLGTDSLASNTGLSILAEMKTLQQAFPDLELETLIQWATKNGADFLGIDHWAGSFTKRKKPGINLIEHADVENLRLFKNSRISVIG